MIVVEILVETVPFSLIVVLEGVLLATMIVTLVAVGAYAWTHRGKERGENKMTVDALWVGVVVLLSLVSVPVVRASLTVWRVIVLSAILSTRVVFCSVAAAPTMC